MKKLMAVLVLSALVPASRAFARGEHSKKDIKLLNDSSAALTSIDADLAQKVQKYATKESGETEAKESEKEEAGEKAETGKDEIKILHEAARKLKSSRPDLAKGLNRFAAKEEKEARGESKGSESRERRTSGDMGHEKVEHSEGGGY